MHANFDQLLQVNKYRRLVHFVLIFLGYFLLLFSRNIYYYFFEKINAMNFVQKMHSDVKRIFINYIS
jgi:hypothetical protein